MRLRTYIGIASVALLFLGPALAHFEVVAPLIGFGVFLLAAALGFVTTAWGIATAIKLRSAAAYLPSALGLPAIVLVSIGALAAGGHPRINDVSTDLVDPPELTRAPSYPEAFKSVVTNNYGDLQPLTLAKPPKTVFDFAVALAKTRAGWTVTRIDADALVFEGIAKTKLFRFVDDFIVRVRKPKTGTGAVVDMRSRSRDGKSDLGVNAARIRSFFASLRGTDQSY